MLTFLDCTHGFGVGFDGLQEVSACVEPGRGIFLCILDGACNEMTRKAVEYLHFLPVFSKKELPAILLP